MKIPVISSLYEKFIGGDLSLLSVGSLLMAIPLTVGVKLVTGEAPFKGMDSLALSKTLDVAKAYAAGVSDIISGFTAALTTLSASGATAGISSSSPPAAILILRRSVAVGQILGYFTASYLVRDEKRRQFLYVCSATRAIFQSYYLMDAQ